MCAYRLLYRTVHEIYINIICRYRLHMLRMFLLFWDGSDTWQLQRCTVAVKKMPAVDWIRGKVACTSVPIARLLLMLVTRLMCDREALNSLVRVFVFSRVLACHIRVAREFHKVTNKNTRE